MALQNDDLLKLLNKFTNNTNWASNKTGSKAFLIAPRDVMHATKALFTSNQAGLPESIQIKSGKVDQESAKESYKAENTTGTHCLILEGGSLEAFYAALSDWLQKVDMESTAPSSSSPEPQTAGTQPGRAADAFFSSAPQVSKAEGDDEIKADIINYMAMLHYCDWQTRNTKKSVMCYSGRVSYATADKERDILKSLLAGTNIEVFPEKSLDPDGKHDTATPYYQVTLQAKNWNELRDALKDRVSAQFGLHN